MSGNGRSVSSIIEESFYIMVDESSAAMAFGFGSDTDLFRDLDMHGNDEQWDLGFPRNCEVDEGAEMSRNENADSDTSRENYNYSNLHALHAHKSSRGGAVNVGGDGFVHAGRRGTLRRGLKSRPCVGRRPLRSATATCRAPATQTSLWQGLHGHGHGSQPSQLGLSVGRAARLPDMPNRPSRPPDKGQTGID